MPELYAIRYGESLLPAAAVFRDGGDGAPVPIVWSLYAARHGDRVTVIDTGFSDTDTARAWGVTVLGEPLRLLEGIGIAADEVETVIVTHRHFDHVDNLHRFPKARVVISARERAACLESASPAVRAALESPRTQAFTGSVTLDDRFRIDEIGGHTEGSSVVACLDAPRPWLITGDECYLCANLENDRPIGIVCDHVRNAAFIRRARAAGQVPLPFHDPLVFTRHGRVAEHVVRIGAPPSTGQSASQV